MGHEASPPTPAELGLPGLRRDEEVDPELLQLPDPPKRGRTFTLGVLLMATLGSLAMAFSLRSDVAYAVATGDAVDLGDLSVADGKLLKHHENHLVAARVRLGIGGAIAYERLFTSDTFCALPVPENPEVWVELRVPEGKSCTGRWEPPKTVEGRLVDLRSAGPRHRGLVNAIEENGDTPLPKNAWLLVNGEAPSTSRWALGLALLFVAVAAWNVTTMIRLVRRVR